MRSSRVSRIEVLKSKKFIGRLNRAYRQARQLDVLYKVSPDARGVAEGVLQYDRRNRSFCVRSAKLMRLILEATDVLLRAVKDALRSAMRLVAKIMSERSSLSRRLFWMLKNGDMAQPIMVALYMGPQQGY